MKYILTCVISLVLSSQVFASSIQRLDVNTSENGDEFTSVTNAVIVGDYNRYVNRMMDVSNWVAIGVPHMVDTRKLGKSLAYIHMSVFFKNVMYYAGTSSNIGPKKTTATFNLSPKTGPLPVQNDYRSINGHTVIQVLSGSGDNTTFSVNSVTHIVLKPEAIHFGVQSVLSEIGKGSVQAFAQ